MTLGLLVHLLVHLHSIATMLHKPFGLVRHTLAEFIPHASRVLNPKAEVGVLAAVAVGR
tara:strand:+ start:148 stop:324 length:177 start_codon:yes stop_codon:yes gene_type:complete